MGKKELVFYEDFENGGIYLWNSKLYSGLKEKPQMNNGRLEFDEGGKLIYSHIRFNEYKNFEIEYKILGSQPVQFNLGGIEYTGIHGSYFDYKYVLNPVSLQKRINSRFFIKKKILAVLSLKQYT